MNLVTIHQRYAESDAHTTRTELLPRSAEQ